MKRTAVFFGQVHRGRLSQGELFYKHTQMSQKLQNFRPQQLFQG